MGTIVNFIENHSIIASLLIAFAGLIVAIKSYYFALSTGERSEARRERRQKRIMEQIEKKQEEIDSLREKLSNPARYINLGFGFTSEAILRRKISKLEDEIEELERDL